MTEHSRVSMPPPEFPPSDAHAQHVSRPWAFLGMQDQCMLATLEYDDVYYKSLCTGWHPNGVWDEIWHIDDAGCKHLTSSSSKACFT